MSSDALPPDDSPARPRADAAPADELATPSPQPDGNLGEPRLEDGEATPQAPALVAGVPPGQSLGRTGELADASATAEEERDALLAVPSTECLNCGRDLPGPYCPGCGQKAGRLRQPVHHFVRDAFLEFFGIDGRIWPTYGALLFKPGTLTREYLAGRRQRYLRPLRVYLVSTLGFFFLLSLIDPIGRGQEVLFDSDVLTDSVRVGDEFARLDSLLSLGDAALDPERAAVAEARQVLDSLETVARLLPDTAAGRAALDDELEEATDEVEDALGDLHRDSLRLADRRPQQEIIRAVLGVMPQDSLIVLDGVRGTAFLIYPDSSTFFGDGGGDDWLMRNQALRTMSGAATEAQRREGLVRFVRSVIGYVPTVLFLILPIFALLLKLLYARRGWFYSEHLIFGLHTHAFAFVTFSVITLVVFAATTTEDGIVQDALGWVSIALLVAIPVYFFIAQKRVYAQGWIKTGVKALLLASVYNIVLTMGLVAVFIIAAFFG